MSSTEEPEKFADVRKHLPFLARHEGLASTLERFLEFPKIRQAFADSAVEENPFAGIARRLDLKIRQEGHLDQIPKDGPVVFVANHGYGGSDALALTVMMHERRPDMRILANQEVMALPGMPNYLFPVSLMQEGSAANQNTSSLRAMLKHVRAGGCLGVFPAGRVAFWQGDRMQDPPWNDHVVKLLQRMEATIVPVWFYGRPPVWIDILSQCSAFLRTALIPTGLAKMQGCEITGKVGEAFSSQALKDAGEDAGPWLRRHLESIADSGN